jgi:hypothetical protein
MMYVTEFLIGNYMCFFFHQLKQKQNTEWMLYKCANTIPEQLLEQVMTISASCQVTVIVYASEAEEFSQVLTKSLSDLSLMTDLGLGSCDFFFLSFWYKNSCSLQNPRKKKDRKIGGKCL